MSLGPIFRSTDALLREPREPFAVHVEVDQREVRAQPVVVFGDASVSRLVEAEDPLQDAEDMLHLGPHTGLGRVLPFGLFVDVVLELGPLAGHILGEWGGLFDGLGLALIAAVAPHLALFAVQQIRQHVLVGDARRRGRHRVNMALFAVDADVRFQPEEPLVALLRLMHLRVAFASFVPGRRRSVDDAGVNDGAGLYLDAFGLQMLVHRVQHLPAEAVLLQQMAEAQQSSHPARERRRDQRQRIGEPQPTHTATLQRRGRTG